MTIIYKHRVNTIKELCLLPKHYGLEVDIRSNKGELIIDHDPFSDKSTSFSEWIVHYNHKGLILNVKEDGLESHIQKELEKYNILDYFYLDQSFPQVYNLSSAGNHHCSLRISEFESIETVISMQNKIEWVWVDYFTHFPLSKNQVELLKNKGFKLCVVSPELQGYDHNICCKLIDKLNDEQISIEAVCTKFPEEWRKYN